MYKISIFIPGRERKLYWSESFPDKKSGERWLAEEKTRIYWQKGFIVEVEDTVAEEAEKAKQLAEKALAEREAQQKLLAELIELRKSPPATVKECAVVIDKLFEYLNIK